MKTKGQKVYYIDPRTREVAQGAIEDIKDVEGFSFYYIAIYIFNVEELYDTKEEAEKERIVRNIIKINERIAETREKLEKLQKEEHTWTTLLRQKTLLT